MVSEEINSVQPSEDLTGVNITEPSEIVVENTETNLLTANSTTAVVSADDEPMVLVKQSDMQRMKDLILKLSCDKADKDAFADVTRRLMYLFAGIPTKTEAIQKIVKFFESCTTIKKGKRQLSIIKLGKKMIVGDLPIDQLASLGDAINLDAFNGFKPIDYGDAFQRNDIPIIDISPVVEIVKTIYFNRN